jgi:flagellar motility protein MotE (MotC chaperone)
MNKNPYDQFFKKAQAVKKRTATQPLRLSRPKRQRRKFPWSTVVGMLVTVAVGTAYLLDPDSFEKSLSKIEFSAFGQASASGKDAAKESAEKSKGAAGKEEKSAAKSEDKAPGASPEGKASVSEDFSHYEKLKQRKEELDAREKELAELEEELQGQKVELDKRLQQLEEMRNQIAQTLKDRVDVDQEKVNKLVELYSNMKPKQAAEVIGTINEDLAVEVLAKMKKKNAAEIMNLLSPEKSRVLSEKYMGYRRLASDPNVSSNSSKGKP